MTQRKKMLKALDEIVILKLQEQGFHGKFPNYRRTLTNRIELLTFMIDKYGGAFTVEVSTVFMNCDHKLSNYYTQDNEAVDEINVYSTNNRYRLKGMINGWFYYTDVYKSKGQLSRFRKYNYYESVGDIKSINFTPDAGQHLIQKADDSLYPRIAEEVNRQMTSAYKWWKKHDTPTRMRKTWFLRQYLK